MKENKEIKRIDIQEFREKGYLQEINRKFLHPLGLALEIVQEDGVEKLGGIWDYREDFEGIHYNIKASNNERKEKFNSNKIFIENQLRERSGLREEKLGFIIEPIL